MLKEITYPYLYPFHLFVAAKYAKKIGLPLGLHLNLTEGAILTVEKDLVSTSETSINTLLCSDEKKVMRGRYGFREAWENGEIDPFHIIAEVKAQMMEFKRIMGDFPIHFDSHQHVHMIPSIAKLISPVLSSMGVRYTRLSIEIMELWPWMMENSYYEFFNEVSRQGMESREIYSTVGIIGPNACVGLSTMGFNLTQDRLMNLIRLYLPVRYFSSHTHS